MNKRRLISYCCLLIYLLVWAGNAQAMPLLLASVAHSHEIFLTYQGDKLQIALHHPGYVDKHEPVPTTSLETYQPDLLDEVLSVLSNRDNEDYSDHLIQVPLDKQPLITSSQETEGKLVKLATAFAFLATAPPFPALIALVSLPILDPPPPDIPSAPIHLRTTVLLN